MNLELWSVNITMFPKIASETQGKYLKLMGYLKEEQDY